MRSDLLLESIAKKMKKLFRILLPKALFEFMSQKWRKLKRNWVLNRSVTVTMPEFPHRQFVLKGVPPDSTLERSIWTYGLYEPFLVKRIIGVTSCHDSFLDVGADIGYYSALFSKIVGSHRVTALEPDHERRHWLQKNVNSRVRIVDKFLTGDTDSDYQISLDTYVRRNAPPSVIKMDTEGGEADVILQSEYIKEYRPRLFVEVHPPEIQQINPTYTERMLDCLFSLYKVEFIRNHWGVVKNKGSRSVADQPGCYEWRLVDHEELTKIVEDILKNNTMPRAFALHCFSSR